VTKEMCICAGVEQLVLPLPQPNGVFKGADFAESLHRPGTIHPRAPNAYTGSVLGMNAGRLLNSLHFLSAGAVSFARGLNDTPKIAALLLVASALDIRWGLVAVAIAIGAGVLLNARKVADTMSHKMTNMNTGQGLSSFYTHL
jgi:inorganic phosphate transporter, PiT family